MRHLPLPNILSIIDYGANFKQTKQTIINTQELCNKFSCKVIVSFVPNSEYFRPDLRADKYADNLILLTSRLGIPFVDGREIINRKKGSQDFAIKGPHLSPIGYEKMAKAISKIKKKK